MKIAVIGCGMSGMAAVISAVRNGVDPRNITIYESSDRPGRKILATGNGRCNLGNEFLDESCFYVSPKGGRKFLSGILSSYSAEDLRDFYSSLGIATVSKNGYLYPRSLQASAVLDAMLSEIGSHGVLIRYSECVNSVSRKDGSFVIETGSGKCAYDAVVISSGFGSGGFDVPEQPVRDIVKDLNISFERPLPALCPLKVKEDIKALAGVRAAGKVSIYVNGKPAGSDEGEIQFTKDTVSGIPVFQISRIAASSLAAKSSVSLRLNMMPELNEDALGNEITSRLGRHPEKEVILQLSGLMNNKLSSYIMKRSGIGTGAVSRDLDLEQIRSLVRNIGALCFEVRCTEDKSRAQTMAGGIAPAELNDGCELGKIPGLFVTGELIDIDGKCGGYNLYLAWATGMSAGKRLAGPDRS